jgi:hypothetical protein
MNLLASGFYCPSLHVSLSLFLAFCDVCVHCLIPQLTTADYVTVFLSFCYLTFVPSSRGDIIKSRSIGGSGALGFHANEVICLRETVFTLNILV